MFKVLGSPIKERTGSLDRPITTTGSFFQTHTSPIPSAAIYAFQNSGSKEDIFFDSRQWLDSDSEDDFFSVNGDFTPSHGNTPVHHSFAVVRSNSLISKRSLKDKTSKSISNPLPKKKLGELLQETRAEEETERRKFTENTGPTTVSGAPQYPHGIVAPERQKSGRCLPNLELCRSFSGRKKRS
ncbi:uncharacterized protein At3g27210-like isoform X1 [Punica granatum]|uniref:Uncharacterized protein At3g27210-like isoform X1 n=1 Tax=Punica granatum TaxID=22663 RepID=A0A218WMD6_PUNGR|nr:uncharacterized protein At3g27210-like isoform X1 [Punica granatum]XP_031403788.1 uncharacterized protein At3g27210-like isoform X1 [Punica granatum]OWM74004.1 hypothetical protein CDL15_Pgr022275 [Punica granatum]